MAGLAGYALSLGGLEAATSAFLAAAATLVLLVFSAALGVASAQEETVRRIKAQTLHVKIWGGWIMIVVGAWLLVLAVSADSFRGVFPV